MDRQIWKNLAMGFLPIMVFFVTDALWGMEAGLMIAIVVGIIYFIYYWLVHHQIEKMILLDTLLILLTGTVSLIMHDALFFKLKPAFIESILTVLVAIHAFSSKPVLLEMSRRFMQEATIQKTQLRMLKQMARLLFIVLLIHVLLIVFSALYLSEAAWAFISGGLFYLMLGALTLGQIAYFRWLRKKGTVSIAGGEEIFDLVDENGRILGQAPRSQVHGNPDLLHPTVHLHIVNSKNQLFLQKRAVHKDLYPGKWDTAVGGHIFHGEGVEQALHRETREELGISVENAQPLFRYVMRNLYESELIHVFKMKYDGPVKINPEELESGRFWNHFEIERRLGRGVFTPNFEQEYVMLRKKKLL